MRELKHYLLGLRPHPAKIYEVIERELPPIEDFTDEQTRAERYAGMTRKQLAWLASQPLFEVGGHTVGHPFLTLCDEAEAKRQMSQGKRDLEEITGKVCDLFAYPAVDYDERTMAACQDCGFVSAFSAHREIQGGHEFELPRTGVYYPELSELGFKIRWDTALRRIQKWRTIPKQ